MRVLLGRVSKASAATLLVLSGLFLVLGAIEAARYAGLLHTVQEPDAAIAVVGMLMVFGLGMAAFFCALAALESLRRANHWFAVLLIAGWLLARFPAGLVLGSLPQGFRVLDGVFTMLMLLGIGVGVFALVVGPRLRS
ncbi:hypothetical protein [Arthrobacter cryoconiti]|uniref:Uncharacterized protein n=1 Tax=Arthrobacter cryoconiti TaxID=748907 RepID=A0ABV8R366_9MICC|nr:hypothetical protein [Arthrobacter cryoconiti]MCC9067185.1 hypothetical protein [Arthrobacter cryoconiti]